MSLIQITKSGIICSNSEQELQLFHDKFKQNHCITLQKFLAPELLLFIQEKINKSGFYEKNYKVDDEKVIDYKPKDKTINSLLRFLINDKQLFKLVEKLTGCPRVGSFNGVVLAMTKDFGNYVTWHNDMGNDRLIGISINLSTEIYSGGIFQIRDRVSKKIIYEVANVGFGDCIVFLVSPELEHKVTSVEGKVIRTVFAGWFRSNPDYWLMVQENSSQLKNKQKKINTVLEHSPVVLKQKILSRFFDKHILIFNPDSGTSYELDPIGKEILDLLEKPITPTEISNVLLSKYEVDPAKCKKDTLGILQELIANNLIGSYKKELLQIK